MSALETNWPKHPLLENLSKEHISLLARTASEERFEPCESIFHEGHEADKFYLIVEGKVAIEILASERSRVTIRTIDAGGVLGWS